MQVFVPLDNFVQCAKVLDSRRLNKQGVECKQILNVLLDLTDGKGWRNHPIMHMWRGHEQALIYYSLAMRVEWKRRGYNDTMIPWFQSLVDLNVKPILPDWWGDDSVHSSHRQTLLCKDPEWYGQFGWKETPKYEYIWK